MQSRPQLGLGVNMNAGLGEGLVAGLNGVLGGIKDLGLGQKQGSNTLGGQIGVSGSGHGVQGNGFDQQGVPGGLEKGPLGILGSLGLQLGNGGGLESNIGGKLGGDIIKNAAGQPNNVGIPTPNLNAQLNGNIGGALPDLLKGITNPLLKGAASINDIGNLAKNGVNNLIGNLNGQLPNVNGHLNGQIGGGLSNGIPALNKINAGGQLGTDIGNLFPNLNVNGNIASKGIIPELMKGINKPLLEGAALINTVGDLGKTGINNLLGQLPNLNSNFKYTNRQ